MIWRILLPGSEGELSGYSCFSVSAPSMSTAVGDASKVSFDDTEEENSSSKEGDLSQYRDVFLVRAIGSLGTTQWRSC